MRGGYSDVNWFLRAARVAPVIAGAALLGGMIGGFAMFAIDSALTSEPSWEPVSRPRLDVRADSAASALVAQTTKPVRIVGGAIPDPSAGMSAPPPAPQQRNAAAPAQSPAQVSPQLLTPKPLGPASRLQPQTATAGPISGAPQQNQTANQAARSDASRDRHVSSRRAGPMHCRAHIRTRRTPQMRQMRIARSSKLRRRLPAQALQAKTTTSIAKRRAAIAPPPPRMIWIALTHPATAVIADATGAGMMMLRQRLHRAGKMRGLTHRLTIAFMILPAIAGIGRSAIRANNLTATRKGIKAGIRTAPLRGPTCRAPRCGAWGARRVIAAGRARSRVSSRRKPMGPPIAPRRSKRRGRSPSRSGAAAFSAAAIRMMTKAK